MNPPKTSGKWSVAEAVTTALSYASVITGPVLWVILNDWRFIIVGAVAFFMFGGMSGYFAKRSREAVAYETVVGILSGITKPTPPYGPLGSRVYPTRPFKGPENLGHLYEINREARFHTGERKGVSPDFVYFDETHFADAKEAAEANQPGDDEG